MAGKPDLLEVLSARPEEDIFGIKYYPTTHTADPRPASISKQCSSTRPFQKLWHDGGEIGDDTHYLSDSTSWNRLIKHSAFFSDNITHKSAEENKISRGDCVLVRSPDISELDTSEDASLQFWKAKVWEIRSIDREKKHLFALVSWFERPKDLPKGPELHHGQYELIATTQMDVIWADTIQDKVSIRCWDEEEEIVPVGPKQYYWRQKRGHGTGSISPCRAFCYCGNPRNPDHHTAKCMHCDLVMHRECATTSLKLEEPQMEAGAEQRADSTCGSGWDDSSRKRPREEAEDRSSRKQQKMELSYDGEVALTPISTTVEDICCPKCAKNN